MSKNEYVCSESNSMTIDCMSKNVESEQKHIESREDESHPAFCNVKKETHCLIQ